MHIVFAATILIFMTFVFEIYGITKLDPVKYLTNYGYLPPRISKTDKIMPSEQLTKAISSFQLNSGLIVTGKMNEDTEKIMLIPRCARKDMNHYGQKYKTVTKWDKINITYSVLKYSAKMKKEDVDTELRKAFNIWANHTNLFFFHLTEGPVDIEIQFSHNYGPKNIAFDNSEGNDLAYTLFPQKGDIWFDESEIWSLDPKTGISLFYTAVHEIGHSLGLAHSYVRNSVMAPFYKTDYSDLRPDDIAGIQKLYGPKKAATLSGNSPTRAPDIKSKTIWNLLDYIVSLFSFINYKRFDIY